MPRKAKPKSWAVRMFGSRAAYTRSLPSSRWINSGAGWYLAER